MDESEEERNDDGCSSGDLRFGEGEGEMEEEEGVCCDHSGGDLFGC